MRWLQVPFWNWDSNFKKNLLPMVAEFVFIRKINERVFCLIWDANDNFSYISEWLYLLHREPKCQKDIRAIGWPSNWNPYDIFLIIYQQNFKIKMLRILTSIYLLVICQPRRTHDGLNSFLVLGFDFIGIEYIPSDM